VIEPAESIDSRLLALLECPRDHSAIQLKSGHLCCAHGHKYPIVSGVPVFILAEKEQTIRIAKESLNAAENRTGGPLYLNTLAISENEKRGIEHDWSAGGEIDPAISYLIGATSGLSYRHLIGRLKHYPIPDIPVSDGNNELLLDIGSSWGRWSVSAARKGWRVVAIDPSLGAILAAERAFSGMKLDIAFVCGDARFLPFKDGLFRCAFSYSVLQHFSERDAALALAELGRVLHRGGFAKVQMAHKGGLNSTYWRARLAFRDVGQFRVRYWSLASMHHVFKKAIGPAYLIPDAFGGLGLLAEDRDCVSTIAKVQIAVSTLLKKIWLRVPWLIRFADSVYVVSTKQ
jgi:SAM-dependent methyltransferase/uncharacterized protein YbaR (Trm112 family)